MIILVYNKFWEELMAYFPFISHGPHKKRKIMVDTQTHRQKSELISVLLFFKIGKVS
jgi:hypothetical protein